MKKAADRERPTTKNKVDEINTVSQFGGYLFDIGWRNAAAVIIFLWGGHALDQKLGTKPWLTVLGFFLVIASFVLIMRQILRKIPKSLGGLKDDD